MHTNDTDNCSRSRRAVQTLDVFTEAPPDGLQSVMFPTLLQTVRAWTLETPRLCHRLAAFEGVGTALAAIESAALLLFLGA